jgi:hypothetical protein
MDQRGLRTLQTQTDRYLIFTAALEALVDEEVGAINPDERRTLDEFYAIDDWSRTPALRARQLPTNHGHAVSTREYQSESSSLPLGRSDDWIQTTPAPGWLDKPGAGLEVLSNDGKESLSA